jgi:hypothetical protein
MCFRNDDTWSLDVRVGATTVTDLRPHALRWSKVFQLTDRESLHFTFETFLPHVSLSRSPMACSHEGHVARGHNMLLTLTVRSMQYVYVQNFVTEWIRYFVEIHSMQQMMAASYARAMGLATNTIATEQACCLGITSFSH